MVQIDKTFGNREPQAEPAELPGHGSISLLKWSKQGSEPIALNSNSVICDFEMETVCIIVEGADGDLSTGRREFHGVVDQIPKHLLKPDAVSQNVMPFRIELSRELQFLGRNG